MNKNQQRILQTAFSVLPIKKTIEVIKQHLPGQSDFKFDVVFKPQVVDVINGREVVRFGKFENNKITINFAKKEHMDNPLEIIDTLCHELVHALCACPPHAKHLVLPQNCFDFLTDPNTPPRPQDLHSPFILKVIEFTNPDYLRGLEDERRRYLEVEYGPSHSDPDEYIDINKACQHFVARWCSTVLRFCTVLDVGPTLTMKHLSETL